MRKCYFLLLLATAMLILSGKVTAQNLPAYLPTNGLVAWYPFNGNANDESGNGNHGTVNGAMLTSDRNGGQSNAYDFNAFNWSWGSGGDYIYIPYNSTFNSSNISISVWFWIANNYITNQTYPTIVKRYEQGYTNPNGQSWGLYKNVNGENLQTFILPPNTTNNYASYLSFSGPNIGSGQWTQGILTFDGIKMRTFVNGILAGEVDANGITLNNNGSSGISIGMSIQANGHWDPFNGKIDDIAIYNRALTQEEITALYTGTPGNNNGGNTAANAVPPGIPYQAVVRNANGQVAANAAATTKFTLHQNTTDGTVEYQETHALSTNPQGLVSAVIGQGTAVQGTFAGINWSNTTKFLQVEVDLGNGYVDLGTQQLMSVPFALYAANGPAGPQGPAGPAGPQGPAGADGAAGNDGQDAMLTVSQTGDTLFTGTGFIIVPGISAANYPNSNSGGSSNNGNGNQFLPANNLCSNENISVTGCGGQSTLTYDGRVYDLVEIGGQCWFADNLATDQYQNGDLIPSGLDDISWQNLTSGAFTIYSNDLAKDATYGKLYNWYAATDSRGVCPSGWHVPSDCEWMYLENSIGMSSADQSTTGWVCCRGENIGSKLKSITGWYAPNSGATDQYLFHGLPSGFSRENQTYDMLGNFSFWWTKSELYLNTAYYRTLLYDATGIIRLDYSKNAGMGIRCLKD